MSTVASLWLALAKIEFLGFEVSPWQILGFAAQGLFFSRFLLQWIASERRGHSYMPVYFWWISLGGGALLLVYVIGQRDLPLVLGQSVGIFVYARNLILIYRKRGHDAAAAAVEAGDALYVHPEHAQTDPDATSPPASDATDQTT